jgi:mono/diheme cytochrome c family protein
MRKTMFVVAALALTLSLVAACGGAGSSGSSQGTGSGGATAPAPAPAGDAKAGEALFAQATIGSNPGCKTCHNISGAQLVGPNMGGIGTRAATRVPGQSAEQYIRTSITDPNAHVVEGFAQGVMPSFKGVLDDTQLNNLVAYLLSLK